MENDLLRKVQLVQLEMLKELNRACKKIGISYFLDSGTLLGAIRHNGFIPWDDDVDVGMLRSDYERFLREAPAVLNSMYYLQHWKTDPQYGLPFAKLRKKGTVYRELSTSENSLHCGFYIDIFPYDTYPEELKFQKIQGWTYNFYRRCIMVKCGYQPWLMNESKMKSLLKHLGYIPVVIFARFQSKEKMVCKYEAVCTMFNNRNSRYLYEQAGAANYGKWVISKECFTEFVDHMFEDEMFPVPVNSHLYLSEVYGDYMKLPPEGKRENRHKIIEVDFGNEEEE